MAGGQCPPRFVLFYGGTKHSLVISYTLTGLSSFLLTATLVTRRQIVSGSRDKTIKLWNTLGECKYTIQEEVRAFSARCTVFRVKLALFICWYDNFNDINRAL